MARKRAPGGGRKSRSPEGAAVPFNTRIAPEIRRRIERDAKRNKHSLSREIELRLADSVHAPDETDPHTRAFCYLVGRARVAANGEDRKKGQETGEFSWRTDRFDFEVLKAAIDRLLDKLAPEGKPVSRYDQYADGEPDKMGHTIADLVLSLLRSPALLSSRAEEQRALSGSYLYAFPQAAAALAVK